MTAAECLERAKAAGRHYQLHINEFVDAFRRAPPDARAKLVEDPVTQMGELEGLIAAVVSALCRETGTPAPSWVERIGSNAPFFAFPARSYALRVRLMMESPARSPIGSGACARWMSRLPAQSTTHSSNGLSRIGSRLCQTPWHCRATPIRRSSRSCVRVSG